MTNLPASMIYGPQTYQIEKLIQKIKSLTPEQITNLGAARGATWDAARGAAWVAARDAARDAARGAAWGAAWVAARDAAWVAAWGAARGAAWDAARALVSRDLIDDKFTQAHYDLLTKSWRDVIGEFEEPPTEATTQSSLPTQKYGPQTYQIEKLIQKIKSLTPEQITNLDVAWDAARGAARGAARDAVWDAVWDAARDAARDAVWDAVWDAARDAARDAALALVSRDLIDDKFTQAHYDLLTKPWRDVVGEFEEPPEQPSSLELLAQAVLEGRVQLRETGSWSEEAEPQWDRTGFRIIVTPKVGE
jgi:hypothetical protein